MGILTLRLLGAPTALRDGRALSFRTRKTLALLAYLATEPGLHSREKLTALLWPESAPALARASLRNTLAYLHNALRAAATPDYIVAQGEALGLDSAAPLDLDLNAINFARATPPAPIAALEAALAAYRGEFLEGFTLPDVPAFDDWIATQRTALARGMADIYERLSGLRLDRGDAAGAAAIAARWAAHDQLNEAAQRRLMQAYLAAGDSAAALRVYNGLRALLLDELGVSPAAATEALAQRIRSGAARAAAVKAANPGPRRQGPGWVEGRLVGRGGEFAALTAVFGAAAAGTAQAVLIEGEAGIGKTRLAEEFLRWAAAAGADVLGGRSFEAGGRVPYAPLVAALRPRLERENAPADLLGDIWLAELARLLPELRERYPDLPPAAPGDTARSTLFEAVARLIAALASSAPLVLFIDDVQWADADTLDLLQYGARRWTELGASVLLLLTLRSEERSTVPGLDRRLLDLARELPLRHLAPSRLDAAATLDLLDTLSLPAAPGASGDARTALARWLYQETGGQPFYLVETLKALLESGLLVAGRLPGGQQAIDVAASRLDAAALAGFLPPSVHEVIRARLARLSPLAFNLLAAAAVLGDEARVEWLCAVAGVDEAAALPALDELLAARLLREGAGGDRYSFTHDKIRSVSYSEAGGARRRLFHRRAFDALSLTAAPAELVRHALAANLPAAVLQSSVAAGFAAMRLFAIQSAIEHFERARRLLAESGAAPQPALAPADLEGLFTQLGRAYQFAGEPEQAGAVFQQMLLLARAAGLVAMESAALNRLATHAAQDFTDTARPRELLREALRAAEQSGDPAVLAETEWTTAQICFYSSDVSATLAHAALAMARRAGSDELTARSLNVMSYAESESYDWHGSAAHAATALEIYHALGDRAMEVDCSSLLAKARLVQGQPHEALAIATRGAEIGREAANPWGHANCNVLVAFILLELGEYEAALALGQETAAIARRAAAHPLLALSLIVIGKAHRLLHAGAQAVEAHLSGLEFVLRVPTNPFKTTLCAELCADYAALGDWAAARAWALQADATDEITLHYLNGLVFWQQTRVLLQQDTPLALAALLRYAGRAANARRYEIPYQRALAEYAHWRGDNAAAVEHSAAAAALAQEIGLPGELWSAQRRLAEFYLALGQHDKAAATADAGAATLALLAGKIAYQDRRSAFVAIPPM